MADVRKILGGLSRIKLPPAENSRLTQIATTGGTYEKARDILDAAGATQRIDYGAGRGHGANIIGGDSFEPFAPPDFTPTFRRSVDIPSEAYDGLTNLNVLNVLDPRTRDEAVDEMGRILRSGGTGIITTRGRDVMSAKGVPGEEPMSLIIGTGDRARYQKGFRQDELLEYLDKRLGGGFSLESLPLGAAGAKVLKKAEGGLASFRRGGQPSEEDDRALLESLSPGGPRYTGGDRREGFGGEAFDKSRRAYAASAPGDYMFSPRYGEMVRDPGGATMQPYVQSWRDKAGSAVAGDSRSPERRRIAEGLVGSAGVGGPGVGLIDFTPYAWGPALAADLLGPSDQSTPMTSTEVDAANNAALGYMAYQMRRPIGGALRVAKRVAASPAGAAVAGTAAAGAVMAPDDAEAALAGFRKSRYPNHVGIGKAQELARKGARPDDIWRDAGVMFMPDGHPRFEISDERARLTTDTSRLLDGSLKFRMRDILDHPELYSQYPRLGEIPYAYNPAMNSNARFMPSLQGQPPRIELGPQSDIDASASRGRIQGSLMHELQHGIQMMEGFAPGSNPEAARAKMIADLSSAAENPHRARVDDQTAARALEMRDAVSRMPRNLQAALAHEAYMRHLGEMESRAVTDRQWLDDRWRRVSSPIDTMEASGRKVSEAIIDGAPLSEKLVAYEALLRDMMPGKAEGGEVDAIEDLIATLEAA